MHERHCQFSRTPTLYISKLTWVQSLIESWTALQLSSWYGFRVIWFGLTGPSSEYTFLVFGFSGKTLTLFGRVIWRFVPRLLFRTLPSQTQTLINQTHFYMNHPPSRDARVLILHDSWAWKRILRLARC